MLKTCCISRLSFVLRQHPVADAKLIDDVALFAGRHAHFLADVLHIAHWLKSKLQIANVKFAALRLCIFTQKNALL